MSNSEPLIDAALANLLQGGVGIGVAACDSDLTPTLARATGCRISPDRLQVTVFLSATQAAPVLRCIRENGKVAVVFSQPSTHRTVQLKASNATVGGIAPGDLDIIAAYRSAFARQVAPFGIPEFAIQTLLSFPSADIVGVSFTPDEAYDQTPGPKAGERLGASS